MDLNAAAEPEWFYGSCNGRSGLFPQAYVQLMENEATSPFVPVQQPAQAQPAPTTVIEGTISRHFAKGNLSSKFTTIFLQVHPFDLIRLE